MFSITKAIEKDYVPAKEINVTSKDHLKMHVAFVQIFLRVFLMLVQEIFKKILSLFITPKLDDISKKLALVSGGGNGLGRELCLRLAQEGCDIAVIDIDLNNAKKVALEVEEKFKVEAKAFHCDVSSYTAILSLKSDIENLMRPVDILVNNAGLLYMSNFLSSSVADIQKVIDVNLTSQFWMVHTFLPGMIERKFGKIISICSAVTLNPLPTAVIYTATKYGVKGFMDTLYDELCINDYDKFINLTTVYPDFMNTRKDLIDVLEKIKHIPLLITPARVADESIKATLLRKRNASVIDCYFNYFIVNKCLPDRVRKEIKSTATEVKSVLNS